jgi:hypothetical protein
MVLVMKTRATSDVRRFRECQAGDISIQRHGTFTAAHDQNGAIQSICAVSGTPASTFTSTTPAMPPFTAYGPLHSWQAHPGRECREARADANTPEHTGDGAGVEAS